MYLDHFGLREAPFRITPHTEFFFAGGNRGSTLDALVYAITHDEGIVKVTGEVGSGKTMLCRVLMERLPDSVETIFLANPSLSRDEILFTLADELQVNLATNRINAVMRALQEHLIDLYAQGRQVVVLIDEAHAMPAETLEEIRLLSNLESNRHKLLQIVLFGQPELNDVLNRNEMRQLKERITHNFSLEPLVRSDVAQYVSFRMRAAGYKGPDVFSPAALKRIAAASLGLTRRINILCDKALLAAFAGNTHLITPSHVKAAIRDAEFRSAGFPSTAQWLGWSATAILIAGAGLTYYRFNEPEAGAMATSSAQTVLAATPAEDSAKSLQTSLPPAASPEAGAATTNNAAVAAISAPTATPATTPAAPSSEATVAKPIPGPTSADSVDTPAKNAMPDPIQATPDAKRKTLDMGPLTRKRFDDTLKWLDSAEDSRWFIQLLSTDADSARDVEGFLANASRLADPESIRVYKVERKEGDRLGVIYGDYPSRAAASQALQQLPAALRVYGPHPRQVRRLRN